MKFTLSLHDYIEQYLNNMDTKHRHCPICYEQHMNDIKADDMKSMLECYKEQIIEKKLHDHIKKHGELPEVDDNFVNSVVDQLEHEMFTYCQQRQ